MSLLKASGITVMPDPYIVGLIGIASFNPVKLTHSLINIAYFGGTFTDKLIFHQTPNLRKAPR